MVNLVKSSMVSCGALLSMLIVDDTGACQFRSYLDSYPGILAFLVNTPGAVHQRYFHAHQYVTAVSVE